MVRHSFHHYFLDFARSMERVRRQTEDKKEDDIQREEEWKNFSEGFNDSKD